MIAIQDIGITGKETPEEIEAQLEEKLGIKMDDLRQSLETATKAQAEELSKEFITLAPYGDYEKLLEDETLIAAFIREEASLSKNWKLSYLEQADTRLVSELLLEFAFDNIAMDPDEALRGLVYVGANGKVKHVFVRVP